ncbi:MAG: hypothetical protein V4550_21160 [Gemmatimonadota bacterium]
MSRFRSYLTALVMVATVTLPPSALSAREAKLDLTGTWQLMVKTGAIPTAAMLTLKQQGDSLTGLYNSFDLGKAKLTGNYKAEKFHFSFEAKVVGTVVPATFTGIVENDSAMSGAVNISGKAGTFTGKRQ